MDYCYQPYRANLWMSGLLSYQADPRDLALLPVWHGIYFLCSGEGISYIGQSARRDDGIRGRLWEHWQNPRKPFGYVICVALPRDQVLIDRWETGAIERFHPEWNRQKRNPCWPILNDVLGIPEYLEIAGRQSVQSLARVGISEYYRESRAEYSMPYRGTPALH